MLTIDYLEFRVDYPLYPHTFDDFVFLISHDRLPNSEMQESAVRPIALWCCIIVVCSFILFILRKLTAADAVNYSTSFIDSVAAFLGNAIEKLSSNRSERCFIIGFSIFALVFKILYTDHLFQLFQSNGDNRVSTLSQLIDQNITVYVDGISAIEQACVQEYAHFRYLLFIFYSLDYHYILVNASAYRDRFLVMN